MGLVLSDETIRRCGAIFDRHPKYGPADAAIAKTIQLLPGNTDLSSVIAKVSLIKTLYATPVFDVLGLSRHIHQIKELDALLDRGDLSAVGKIRSDHGILTRKNQRELDFYSFATKYCSFHNSAAYPIYDSFVATFVMDTHLQTGMISSRSGLDLGDYLRYKTAIDAITSRFGVTIQNYKELDKGLWIIAKYYKFRPDKASADDRWIKTKIETEFGIDEQR